MRTGGSALGHPIGAPGPQEFGTTPAPGNRRAVRRGPSGRMTDGPVSGRGKRVSDAIQRGAPLQDSGWPDDSGRIPLRAARTSGPRVEAPCRHREERRGGRWTDPLALDRHVHEGVDRLPHGDQPWRRAGESPQTGLRLGRSRWETGQQGVVQSLSTMKWVRAARSEQRTSKPAPVESDSQRRPRGSERSPSRPKGHLRSLGETSS